MNVRSLEFRLTLMVTLVCTIILCLVGILTYLGIDRILIREQDQALASRIERLEILLQDSENIQQIVQKPKIYQNMLGNQDNLFILIHDKEKLININPLDINIPDLIADQKIHFLDLHQGELSTRIAWKNFEISGQSYQLIAGKQWSERLGILYSFRNDLIFYFGIGIGIICLLCWFVCRFGLTGLRELTHQTQAIDIQSLQQRIVIRHKSSDIMQLSHAINHMLQRIESGYQELNRFSENIAHEFRTPLNNVMGQTEILLSEPRTSAQYQELLISHLDEYQRLRRMIDSMLFLARAEQQQVRLDFQSIEIQEFIENILSFYELLASEKRIQIMSEVENLIVKTDPDLLQRAISNLVENAVLHGSESGIIHLYAKYVIYKNREMIKISVLSQDVFIENQHLPYIFERFYQCQSSRHLQGRSGGLGLSIVASIMKLQEGDYHVENTECGVCFSLYIPIH